MCYNPAMNQSGADFALLNKQKRYDKYAGEGVSIMAMSLMVFAIGVSLEFCNSNRFVIIFTIIAGASILFISIFIYWKENEFSLLNESIF